MARSIRTEAHRLLVERLVAARKAAGLTQKQLADRLDRPQSFVAKVEGMERRLDVVEFLEVTTAIGADPLPVIRAINRIIKA